MKSIQIGQSDFHWGMRTYIMGIINVTPDSFSGDGVLSQETWIEAAVEQGKRFVAEGAHMLDVGGESTRPGGEPISETEELRRVLPVVRALAEVVTVPISIDTYKANVAREAVKTGAHCINDVWGGRKDPKMYTTAASLKVPIILMHNRSAREAVREDEKLGARYVGVPYKDVVADIARELSELAETAESSGMPRESIILDPGFGFGKTVEQNIELLRRFKELTALGYPLLAGVSRKSFVGYTLNLPPEERLEGTIAAAVLSAERGADIVRVHDVREVARALAFTDAVTRRS